MASPQGMARLTECRKVLILLAAASFAVGMFLSVDRPRQLSAEPSSLLQDTDGDLLPDALEWVLLSQPGSADSDRDGIDDFLEAVRHSGLGDPQPSLDHEMRVAVATVHDEQGVGHVVANFMFRAVGDLGDIKSFKAFAVIGKRKLDISPLIAHGLLGVASQTGTSEGSYLIFSVRLGFEDALAPLLPLTIGADATIGTKSIRSGTFLMNVDGSLAALVPYTHKDFAIQTLSARQDPRNPFWKNSHACVLQLVEFGRSGQSALCEVECADCDGAKVLRCAQSCPKMKGLVVVIPHGLGVLRGKGK